MLNRSLIRSIALIGALMVPAVASAATAIATTNVNLRAGPSTSYPVVDVVRGGGAVNVHGCLSNRSWCDVTYQGYRGWMSSNYLAQARGGQRYTGPRFVEQARPPVITFSFGNYWDRHYSGRQFYRDRERYRSIHGQPGRPPQAQPPRQVRPPQAQPPRRDRVEQGRRGDDRGPGRGDPRWEQRR